MSSEACPSIYLMLLPKILDPKQRPKVVVNYAAIALLIPLIEKSDLPEDVKKSLLMSKNQILAEAVKDGMLDLVD